MKAIKKRSPCPVACTLDVVGDKWTLLVIRDMLCGKSRFHEFASSPEGIASNILASRLERLVATGLVEAYASKDRATTDEYRLTEKGQRLEPVLEAIKQWGLSNIRGTQARMVPRRQ